MLPASLRRTARTAVCVVAVVAATACGDARPTRPESAAPSRTDSPTPAEVTPIETPLPPAAGPSSPAIASPSPTAPPCATVECYPDLPVPSGRFGDTLVGGVPLWPSTSGGEPVDAGLHPGQLVQVYETRSDGGQDWYRVLVRLPRVPGEWVFGWLPATVDGQPTLARSQTYPDPFAACPDDPPAGWLIASQPSILLLCAYGATVTLEGFLSEVEFPQQPIFSGAPAWLANEPTLVVHSAIGPAVTGVTLGLHINPASSVTYTPDMLSDREALEGTRLYVTGHVGDLASEDCRRAPRPPDFLPMTDDEQVRWCRQQFVVDQIHVGDFVHADLQDLDTCENPVDGYRISFPDAWYSNTEYDGVAACRFFNPGPFVVMPGVDAAGVAITVRRIPGNLNTFDFTEGFEEITAAGRPVRRYELHGALGEGGSLPGWYRIYTYEVQLTEDRTGETLVLSATNGALGDYAANRAVLDAMVENLELTTP